LGLFFPEKAARDASAAMNSGVVLIADAAGAIVSVLDAATRRPLVFETEDDGEAKEPQACPKLVDASGEGSGVAALPAWDAFSAHALAFVALPNCAPERQLPSGCAYVMDARAVPPADSFFPLDLAYADGVTMVELETNVRDSGLALTESFFQSADFRRALGEARHVLRGASRGAQPGVLTREMHEHLLAYTSPAWPDDPHLRKNHPDPFEAWTPQLAGGDFAGVFKSTWDRVHRHTKAMMGHSEGQVHFYAAVGWALPEEIADQVAHVVRANPGGAPWRELLRRKESVNAERLAEGARAHALNALLRATSLSPKTSCPSPVSTSANVLRVTSIPASLLPGGQGEAETECAVFYANCAPTDERDGGVLAAQAPPPLPSDAPAAPGVRGPTLYHFHGPRKTGVFGGGSWQQPATAHAFPCAGSALKCNRAFLEAMVELGYQQAWGYAKLEPVAMVPL
jgi:hypothetical protein